MTTGKKFIPVSRKIAIVRRKAERARSLKGVPLPEAIIEKICELQAKRPDLTFEVGSGDSLVRNKAFFCKYSSTLYLYDETGKPFRYSGKAKAILQNRIFVGISYSEKYKRARVYARFPFE